MPSFSQAEVQNPHLSLPFRFGGVNGGAFVNEQDSTEDIIQCIETLIAYPIGSHPNVPGFGTPDVLFKSSALAPIIPDSLKTAILQWEERARQDMEGEPFLTDDLIQQIVSKVGISDA